MNSCRVCDPGRVRTALLGLILLCGSASAQNPVEAAGRTPGQTASSQQPEQLLVLEQQRAEFERAGDQDGVAACEHAIGKILGDLGRLSEALPRLEKAVTIFRTLHREDHPDLGVTMYSLAGCLSSLGRLEEARSMAEAALAMAERLYEDDHEGIVLCQTCLAICLERLDRAEEALPRHEAALAMRMRLHPGDHPDLALCLSNVARCLTGLAKYDTALAMHEKALAMARRLHQHDHPIVAQVLLGLGECLCSVGRPAEALPRLETALAMYQRIQPGDSDGVALSLDCVAMCLLGLGQSRDALPRIEASLAMWRRLHPGDVQNLAMASQHLAICLRSLRRYEESLAIAEGVLAMQQPLHPGDDHGEADSLFTVADCMDLLGRLDEALAQKELALAMFQRLYPGDHPEAPRMLHSLSSSLLSLGRSAEAVAKAEAALAMCGRLYAGSNHPDIARCLSALALLRLEVEGNAEASAAMLVTAIERIEQSRDAAQVLSTEDRSSYFDKLKLSNPYATMRRAQARLGHPDLALDYTERGRARAVLDLLASGQFDALSEAERRALASGDAAGAAAIRQVKAEVETADAELGRIHHAMARLAERRALPDEARTQQKAQLDADLRRASESREQAQRARSRAVVGLEPIGEPATAKELQAALSEGELLLLWALGEKGSQLFVVPPTGAIDLVAIAATSTTAARAVMSLRWDMISAAERKELTEQGEAHTAIDPRTFAQSILPDAVWQRVRAARRVFAVPDGALHRLPLETLFVGERDGAPLRWLDDGPPIAYVASGSVLRWLRQRARVQSAAPVEYELVAVGDPVFEAVEPVLPDHGALVDSVLPDSQAARLGLQARDVLLAYDDKPLADDASLRDAMAAVKKAVDTGQRAPGSIALRVQRDGKEETLAAAPAPLGVRLGRGSARAAWAAGYGQSLDEQLQLLVRGGGRGPFDSLTRLPGTRDEVEAISKALAENAATSNVRKLLGGQATEAAVFELAGKARYLHLATHGIADETDAASFSALALTTPATATMGDDGFLKLTDLTTHWGGRLAGCSMVVLSACRTQVGPQIRDEAPYALPIGFLFAGARSVVATQWMVADKATARLMADFYTRIRAQGDKPDRLLALTEAKKALRSEYPNPYFWAAFVFVGSPD